MSPKKARTIYLILYATAFALLLLVYIMQKSDIYTFILSLAFGAGIILIVSSIIEMAFWRCKHCSRYLGRQKFIEYCPHCGMPIE